MISMWQAKHRTCIVVAQEHQSGQAEVFDAHTSLGREYVAVSSSSGPFVIYVTRQVLRSR